MSFFSWMLWLAFMVPILSVSFVFGTFTLIMIMHEVGHSRILRSDHVQLLEGCREMIANFEDYTNAVRAAQWNRDHQVKPINLCELTK